MRVRCPSFADVVQDDAFDRRSRVRSELVFGGAVQFVCAERPKQRKARVVPKRGDSGGNGEYVALLILYNACTIYFNLFIGIVIRRTF